MNVNSLPNFSIVYSLPYLFSAALVLMVGYNQIFGYSKKTASIKCWLFIAIYFLLFFGFRGHILSDSMAYEEQYYSITPIFNWDYIERNTGWWDPGFVVFTMFTQLIYRDFNFFMFINSLIDIVLFCLCLKKFSKNYAITILFFLAFQGILIEINMMRNIKAMLLFVYSLSYVKDRKLIKFLICNIIAFFFHSSALLYFPMYWVLIRRYNRYGVFCILICCTIIYLGDFNFIEDLLYRFTPVDGRISEKIAFYMDSSEGNKFTSGTYERLFTMIMSYYAYYKLTKRNRKVDQMFVIFFNSFVMFYVLYSIFGFNFVFRDRIPNLFIFSYWFLYPYLFDFYASRKLIYKVLFVILVFAKIASANSMCSALYENILIGTYPKSVREKLLQKSL